MSNTTSKRLESALIKMVEDTSFSPRQRLSAAKELAQIKRDKIAAGSTGKRKLKPSQSQATNVLGSR